MAAMSSTEKRLSLYALAAGATAIGGASAHGAVIYSGAQNLSIGSGFSQQIDLDGDAQTDLKLKNYVFSGGRYQGASVNFAPGKLVGFQSGNAYVTALAAGAPINSTTANPTFFGSLAYGAANPNAQFNNASGAFIGLSFPSGANTYYGWVRVDINNAAGTFVVRDWAYESTAGGAINAGAGLVIPEPGSLSLLAAGAGGLGLMRRRAKLAK